MRIDSPSIDVSLLQNAASKSDSQIIKNQKIVEQSDASEGKEVSKEKLQQVVDSINEFLEVDHKASKFVLHDGLERYYVRLVDTDTDEVIKEIPPERLLDAFYKMQKLAGMIVDEKI